MAREKDGVKREAIEIVADNVQFLSSPEGAGGGGGGGGNGFTPQSDIPVDTGDFVAAPTGSGGSDDDIPF